MDLIKQLTGKNPSEYEPIAKSLVNNSDIELFKKLVQQDDFLFDFIKNNVAKRIQKACNKENYLNLLNFLNIYSASYETVITEVLHNFGGNSLYPKMKELFLNGDNAQKTYSAKFFSLLDNETIAELLHEIRTFALSDFEPLSTNSIALLAKLNDTVSKNKALQQLESQDEFEQYNGVKFLVTYGAQDTVDTIINVMKKSSLAENIAAEIPYLISIEELLKQDFDNGILVLCNIINAIPEIISISAVFDYNLFELFESLYSNNLTSTSSLLLIMAKEKFKELTENEEYLFDCDKNTKDEVYDINNFLSGISKNKLSNLLYEELYDESDFVLFAVDYVDETEELETLLESKNQTLVLKVLTKLKELGTLKNEHKEKALKYITNQNIKNIALAI